jgi:hypothetical protein
MRFPLLEQLDLPCVFEHLIPGRLHPDGRRYLPQIVLRPTAPGATGDLLLAVVDRHHRVAEAHQGRAGSARLVCALSHLSLQAGQARRGLVPEPEWRGGASADPTILGRVVAIAAWEVTRGELPYEALYTELTLDIGLGIVGLRTSLTAPSLAAMIGKPSVETGDHITLTRSRIDILGFTLDD